MLGSRLLHLEGEAAAVGRDDGVGGAVALVVVERGYPPEVAAAVEPQLPDVELTREHHDRQVALHEHVTTGGVDALGLLVPGRPGLVGDAPSVEVDANDL